MSVWIVGIENTTIKGFIIFIIIIYFLIVCIVKPQGHPQIRFADDIR